MTDRLHSTAGWTNYCATCQARGASDERARYWVRAIDINERSVRRFTGEESRDLHVCVEPAASAGYVR